MSVKRLLYAHSKLTPLMALLAGAVNAWLNRRLAPALRRLMPAAGGRRFIHIFMLLLGLVVQAVMLWLLSELVSLCIGLYELWAILAKKYVELP